MKPALLICDKCGYQTMTLDFDKDKNKCKHCRYGRLEVIAKGVIEK